VLAHFLGDAFDPFLIMLMAKRRKWRNKPGVISKKAVAG
jgi:hypothetical protein